MVAWLLTVGVWAGACVGHEEGIAIDVMLTAPRPRIGDGLQTASLVVEELTLEPCASASSFFPDWMDAPSAYWMGVPSARAHGATGPVTARIDLREQPVAALPALRPQPGTYCGVRLHLGADYEDAATVEGVDGMSGEVGGENETFRLAERQDVFLAFDAPRTYDGQMPTVERFVVSYDPAQWMRDGDFQAAFSLVVEQH